MGGTPRFERVEPMNSGVAGDPRASARHIIREDRPMKATLACIEARNFTSPLNFGAGPADNLSGFG